MKIPKPVSIGTGIGLGSIQVALLKDFVGLKWSVFGNIIIGGAALGITYFTNIVKNEDVILFLTTYGFTAVIGGLIYGILELPAMKAKLRVLKASLTGQAAAYNGYPSEEYQGVPGTFVRRPQSKARGFASDISINPMAAIPTTLPGNKIIF